MDNASEFLLINHPSDRIQQRTVETFRGDQEVNPQSPFFCAEFYTGWYSTWGRGGTPRGKLPQPVLDALDWMLERNIGFNLYMAHGAVPALDSLPGRTQTLSSALDQVRLQRAHHRSWLAH